MATYRIDSLEKLGPALERFLNRAILVVQEELRAEIAEQAIVKLVDISPVGNFATDPHPGKYRASHTVSVGSIQAQALPDQPAYPIPGIEAVSAALSGSDPGESVFLANGAVSGEKEYPYGKAALEPGRRQYSRVSSRTTMWIGSEQAPEGIYGPTVEALLGLRGTIEANAVKRAQRRMA